MGPDGGPRRAFNIVNGKEPLYRIEVARKEDLVVTANHILVLHLDTNQRNHYQGPTVDRHRQTFKERFGELPEPSSDPADGRRPNNLVKQRPGFMSALKSGLAWLLNVDRNEKGAATLRNALNGTTGIKNRESSYTVNIPIGAGSREEVATFCWGNPARKGLKGHPNHPPVFFPTKEDAFAAAVAKSREVHDQGDVTLDKLRARFLEKSANGKNGRIKVDTAMPGLFLTWNYGRTDLRIHVRAVKMKKEYARSYAFQSLPGDDEHGQEDDELSDSDDVQINEGAPGRGRSFPQVTAAGRYQTITMTAAEFAALSPEERTHYRLFRAFGFEYPEQAVPVNPYFLGLWLGDGSRRSAMIYNNHETEIRDFLVAHAAELDLQLVWHHGFRYSTVANTRLADRPLPPTSVQDNSVAKRAEISARSTIVSQRLAAGWTVMPGRESGQARIWYPPGDLATKASGHAGTKHGLSSSPPPSLVRRQRRRTDSDDVQITAHDPVTDEPHSESAASIPEDPLDQLRSDPDFMWLVGPPEALEDGSPRGKFRGNARRDRTLD